MSAATGGGPAPCARRPHLPAARPPIRAGRRLREAQFRPRSARGGPSTRPQAQILPTRRQCGAKMLLSGRSLPPLRAPPAGIPQIAHNPASRPRCAEWATFRFPARRRLARPASALRPPACGPHAGPATCLAAAAQASAAAHPSDARSARSAARMRAASARAAAPPSASAASSACRPAHAPDIIHCQG